MEATKSNRTIFLALNLVVAIAFVALAASPLISTNKNGVQSIGSFILFWCVLPVFWLVGLMMRRGFLTSFLWALLWFFGTGLAVFTVGMLLHGVH